MKRRQTMRFTKDTDDQLEVAGFTRVNIDYEWTSTHDDPEKIYECLKDRWTEIVFQLTRETAWNMSFSAWGRGLTA